MRYILLPLFLLTASSYFSLAQNNSLQYFKFDGFTEQNASSLFINYEYKKIKMGINRSVLKGRSKYDASKNFKMKINNKKDRIRVRLNMILDSTRYSMKYTLVGGQVVMYDCLAIATSFDNSYQQGVFLYRSHLKLVRVASALQGNVYSEKILNANNITARKVAKRLDTVSWQIAGENNSEGSKLLFLFPIYQSR